MNRSVCIIRSNPVNPDSRVEKEALSLQRNGYRVHVLGWDRDSDHPEQDDVLALEGTSIPVTRLGYRASYGEGLKNIVPYLKFQLHMRRYLRRHKFDMIHACDFDTAFFSIGVAKRKREKFVFDIFDFLQSDPKNLLERLVHRAVYGLIRHADATIICTEQRRQQIAGSKPRRLEVIHNSPALLPEDADAPSGGEKSGRIKVVYVGVFQDYRLLREIGSYFEKHPEYEWHVAGFGKLQPLIEQLAERCGNIFFYGRIPYSATLRLERSADIMLAVYDPAVPNHRFAAPNKFYESLMLGKPVIMVRQTGMSEIVEEKDIGVLIDYSEDGFGAGMKTLVSRASEWGEMSERMRRLYQEKYQWSEMERRLLALYDSL